MNRLISLLTEYLQAHLEYYKVYGFEKLMQFIVTVVLVCVLFIMGVFMLLFVALASAFWLGSLLQDLVAGYFIVAAAFVLLAFLVWVMRKRLIERPLIKAFSRGFVKDDVKNPAKMRIFHSLQEIELEKNRLRLERELAAVRLEHFWCKKKKDWQSLSFLKKGYTWVTKFLAMRMLFRLLRRRIQ